MSEQIHILVVDDERNYLLVLETLLTDAGYKVTTLNDPETVPPFLEESEVDVVVTDLEWDPWSAGPVPASMRFVVPEIMWDDTVVARFITSSEQEGATFPAVRCLEG